MIARLLKRTFMVLSAVPLVLMFLVVSALSSIVAWYENRQKRPTHGDRPPAGGYFPSGYSGRSV
jgi:cell division protein FtsL